MTHSDGIVRHKARKLTFPVLVTAFRPRGHYLAARADKLGGLGSCGSCSAPVSGGSAPRSTTSSPARSCSGPWWSVSDGRAALPHAAKVGLPALCAAVVAESAETRRAYITKPGTHHGAPETHLSSAYASGF